MADYIDDAVRSIENGSVDLGLSFSSRQYNDDQMAELMDCMIAYPNSVKSISLGRNRLTDVTCAKAAQWIAKSDTVTWFSAASNTFSVLTYLDLAKSLCTNSSLDSLYSHDNQVQVNRTYAETAFIHALRLNSQRFEDSTWWLFDFMRNDFYRLEEVAQQLGPPLMLAQLDACEVWHNKEHSF